MYRFRTIENLLGKYQELENQEIYFAKPEELNDPMEGYKDIFWQGDPIVWKNFIINYVRSVEHFCTLLNLLTPESRINEKDILVSFEAPIFHTPENKMLTNEILEIIFQNKFINNLPKLLSARTTPVRRNEILFYLQLIHNVIVKAISDLYIKKKIRDSPIFNQDIDLPDLLTNLAYLTNQLENENSHIKNITDNLFSIMSRMTEKLILSMKSELSDMTVTSSYLFLIDDFPEKYMTKLETLLYQDWYSASFLKDNSNSSLWGHYGENHKGVCLKFKTTQEGEKYQIKLKKFTEPSSLTHSFHRIEYSSKHVEIDFFRSFGRLPKYQLMYEWYKDEKGNLSNCGDHLENNIDEWRKKYQENFLKAVTVKLKDWKYEKEYRLIINDILIEYRDKDERKLKYDFDDLEAIIFGIKTSTSDKIRILKIIKNKCEQNNRKKFDFYQAYYSKDTWKIATYKLDLL